MSKYYDRNDTVLLGCGSGGEMYHQLIHEVFLPAFRNPYLDAMEDSAICPIAGDNIAVTTDSFVVRPRFFPGGDIGRLAVCGTVNDLAVSGANPVYITVGMIIEAGFPIKELKLICSSMAEAAKEAGVLIVSGDTKVVEAGCCDGIFINTAGVGTMDGLCCMDISAVAPGDDIIVSGNIASHGIAVMAARYDLELEPIICSDVSPLNGLTRTVLKTGGVRVMRDPTRGGIASTLNEWAEASGLAMVIDEEAVPMEANVATACDILGIDPFYCANEGKILIIANPDRSKTILETLRRHPYGKDARIIGKVQNSDKGAFANTFLNVRRRIGMINGEQLPRIC